MDRPAVSDYTGRPELLAQDLDAGGIRQDMAEQWIADVQAYPDKYTPGVSDASNGGLDLPISLNSPIVWFAAAFLAVRFLR